MKIRIPDTIWIGGREFEIVSVPNLGEFSTVDGSISYRLGRISIGILENRDAMTLTLLHEIMEGIDTVYISEDTKHSVIDRLGEGMFQVFRGLNIQFDWDEFLKRKGL